MSLSTQLKEILDKIRSQTMDIPVSERLRLRAVSRRLLTTLEDSLQQERSLVIRVVNPSDFEEFERGELPDRPAHELLYSVPQFTNKTKAIKRIRRRFPHVTEMTIISDVLVAWSKTSQLLRLYAATLTSLKMDGTIRVTTTQMTIFRRVADTINGLESLTSLHLPNGSLFRLLPQLGPTLSRLERFTLEKPVYLKNAAFIAASLSSRCTHLCLSLAHNLATFPPEHKAINLTHLQLKYTQDSVLQFVWQLPRLTTLILHDQKKVKRLLVSLSLSLISPVFLLFQPELATLLTRYAPILSSLKSLFLESTIAVNLSDQLQRNSPFRPSKNSHYRLPTFSGSFLGLSLHSVCLVSQPLHARLS